MQKITEFLPNGSRYQFDFKLCHFSKGWAQLDTNQDASWYGTWINPLTRQLCTFAEGDLTIIACDNDAEFILEVNNTFLWHEKSGHRPAIDGMCSDPIIARFRELGLGSMLH